MASPLTAPSSRKRVAILGSTGSIGESSLKVARDIPDRMEVVALAAHRSGKRILEQAREFGVRHVALADESAARQAGVRGGAEALVEHATLPEVDLVIIAIVGTGGLAPALAALEAGKDVAVASKEILVLAGQSVMETAARNRVRVLPIDSEHNAVFQCLENSAPKTVRRIILTASGGPFRRTPASQLRDVTVEQALRHPTWDMGRKITIDSATLFNKGLEMIEAKWLFNVDIDQVDVVVHPQSVVHSMVEFIDHSILAQLSRSDMCFPIQYAVTWPERVPNSLEPLDFSQLGQLEFEPPRLADFPALNLARRAGKTGGTLPAVLNAANEVAVAAFLERKIRFPAIWDTVAAIMDRHQPATNPSLETLLNADAWARDVAAELVR